MAVARNTSTDDCKYCGDELDDFYSPGYCSEQCFFSYQAQPHLNVVRREHSLCATCMTPIKDIESPTDGWIEEHCVPLNIALANGGEIEQVDGRPTLDATECHQANGVDGEYVVGYQYRKPRATTVVKEYDSPDGSSSIKQTGTGCSCGNVNPARSVDDIKDIFANQVLANYVNLFRELYRLEEVDTLIDKNEFFAAFKEKRDWDYALGKAMY